MWEPFVTGHEMSVLVRLEVSLACGFLIGIERESRGKPAGISTHCLVIGGAALFTPPSAWRSASACIFPRASRRSTRSWCRTFRMSLEDAQGPGAEG